MESFDYLSLIVFFNKVKWPYKRFYVLLNPLQKHVIKTGNSGNYLRIVGSKKNHFFFFFTRRIEGPIDV